MVHLRLNKGKRKSRVSLGTAKTTGPASDISNAFGSRALCIYSFSFLCRFRVASRMVRFLVSGELPARRDNVVDVDDYDYNDDDDEDSLSLLSVYPPQGLNKLFLSLSLSLSLFFSSYATSHGME